MFLDRLDVVSRTVGVGSRPPSAIFRFACCAGVLLVAAALVGWPGSAAAQGDLPIPGRYLLTEGSTYQEGCFPPCACPITEEMPVEGTLTLLPADTNPLQTTYSVSNVQWRIRRPGGEVAVTGSGTYRVGGELAVTQQLTLDLRVGDGEVLRLDSGLVPEGDQLPDLNAVVSLHGMECYDQVFRIRARSLVEVAPHASLALVPDGSSIALSLFAGGASSTVYGTLQLVFPTTAGGAGSSAGELGFAVEGADLVAPDLAPELPGVGGSLHMTLDPTVVSTGTWDQASANVVLDLHLVAVAGSLPVPMPVRLRGTFDGSRLSITGDNGGVPDASLGLTVEAFRLTTRDGRASSAPAAD